MLLYLATPPASTLLPNQCDIAWTDLSRVLSDNVPQAAGLGAIQIAQQALNLSPSDAAQLVSSGGNTSPGFTPPHGAAAAVAAPVSGSITPVNGVRLPIGAGVTTNSAFLNGDKNRGLLLLQNNNSAGNANLLFSVDGPVDTTAPGFYINLAPGFGILLDQAVLINPIYVAWGPGTVDLGGVCLYGSAVTTNVTGGGVAAAGVAADLRLVHGAMAGNIGSF
jgi:hypothetical protein